MSLITVNYDLFVIHNSFKFQKQKYAQMCYASFPSLLGRGHFEPRYGWPRSEYLSGHLSLRPKIRAY